jgi:hypothetical protein
MADSGGNGNVIDVYAKVVARAWREPAFKAKLLADPVGALAAMDIAVPPGVTVKMVEDTDQVRNLILPPPPAGTGLSDEALEKAAVEALQGLGGFHGSY